MTKILVTGGAGYVGSHVCKMLARSGYDPIVYDNLSRGHADFVQWGPLEQGDILDSDRLCSVFKRYRPAAVMHFAALAYVGESVSEPGIYYRNNVLGSLSLVEAMLSCGVAQMVFSSTCAVYGAPAQIPITEATSLDPINPYGRTKLTVESILTDFDTAHALKAVSLRYFNAAGADPEAEIGERHEPETHAIPLAVLGALGMGAPFRLFGNDYDTPDGTAIRDYIHVNDLASAHVAALDYLLNGGDTIALNLGTGRGTSVREVIDSVERITGRSVTLEISSRRSGDPPVLVADAGRAQTLLEWMPTFTSIDAVVETAVRWHKREGRRDTP